MLYVSVFLLGFAESLPFIGLLFPGAILFLLAGAILWIHDGNVLGAMLLAAIGSMIGDIVSFEYGRRRNRAYARRKLLLAQIARADVFLKRHAHLGILLGRLRGALRPMVSLSSGRAGARRLTYYPQAALGIVLRVSLCIMSGYTAMIALRTAFLWIARSESFLLALLLTILLAFGLWKWAVRRGKRALTIFTSLVHTSVQDALRQRNVKRWMRRHPWIERRVRRGVAPRGFFGLTFTLIVLAIAECVVLLWHIAFNYLTNGPLVTLDMNTANLILAFRNPELLRGFYAITLLGGDQMVLGVATLFTLVLWLKRNNILVFTLWLNLALTTIATWEAKLLFARARPGALYASMTEFFYAFPSAHAAYAVSLYGFTAWIALRGRGSWRRKMSILFGATTCVLLIDMSRVYLGVHYVSDVLAGNLLGIITLLLSICVGEWLKHRRLAVGDNVSSRTFNVMTVSCIALACGLILTIRFPSGTASILAAPDIPVQTADMPTLLKRNSLPQFTETLTGARQEPISLMIVAPSQECIQEQFAKAGWAGADALSPMSLYRGLRTAILNEPYPTAPMTPSFYDGKPHDVGLQKSTQEPTVRIRHHARLWPTPLVTPAGRIFVGTASLDTNIKWGGWKIGLTHAIDPNIDEERDGIALDLFRSGVLASDDLLPFVGPIIGKNFTGDTFTTDGKIAVLELKPCREGSRAVRQ